MRLNVYSQELANETEFVSKMADTGVAYHAVRLFLHSYDGLHDRPGDDDRSAVTFWIPRSEARRADMALAFERLAAMVRAAPPETGLD